MRSYLGLGPLAGLAPGRRRDGMARFTTLEKLGRRGCTLPGLPWGPFIVATWMRVVADGIAIDGMQLVNNTPGPVGNLLALKPRAPCRWIFPCRVPSCVGQPGVLEAPPSACLPSGSHVSWHSRPSLSLIADLHLAVARYRCHHYL